MKRSFTILFVFTLALIGFPMTGFGDGYAPKGPWRVVVAELISYDDSGDYWKYDVSAKLCEGVIQTNVLENYNHQWSHSFGPFRPYTSSYTSFADFLSDKIWGLNYNHQGQNSRYYHVEMVVIPENAAINSETVTITLPIASSEEDAEIDLSVYFDDRRFPMRIGITEGEVRGDAASSSTEASLLVRAIMEQKPVFIKGVVRLPENYNDMSEFFYDVLHSQIKICAVSAADSE
ncbi:MAG: hypothetical protein HYS44_01055 [Candidatus Niyogibacteria bacterium]|nr:hypothetical protein [Candidatus Niyogibacteria bacterium]